VFSGLAFLSSLSLASASTFSHYQSHLATVCLSSVRSRRESFSSRHKAQETNSLWNSICLTQWAVLARGFCLGFKRELLKLQSKKIANIMGLMLLLACFVRSARLRATTDHSETWPYKTYTGKRPTKDRSWSTASRVSEQRSGSRVDRSSLGRNFEVFTRRLRISKPWTRLQRVRGGLPGIRRRIGDPPRPSRPTNGNL